mgnify:CR=1 FL=1
MIGHIIDIASNEREREGSENQCGNLQHNIYIYSVRVKERRKGRNGEREERGQGRRGGTGRDRDRDSEWDRGREKDSKRDRGEGEREGLTCPLIHSSFAFLITVLKERCAILISAPSRV